MHTHTHSLTHSQSTMQAQCNVQLTLHIHGTHLQHLLNQTIDKLLTVAILTTLNEMDGFLAGKATSRVAQAKGPQERVGLLEVGSNGHDLMDQVLHADDAVLAEGRLNHRIVRDGDALLVDLGKAALVAEFAHRLEVGVAPGHKGAHPLQHLEGGLVELDEDARIDAREAQQLQNLAGLGADLVDTLDAHDESQLGLGRHIVGVLGLGLASQTNLIPLLGTVLVDVGFGALEDDLSLDLVVLYAVFALFFVFG
jgi:hypothetical protein